MYAAISFSTVYFSIAWRQARSSQSQVKWTVKQTTLSKHALTLAATSTASSWSSWFMSAFLITALRSDMLSHARAAVGVEIVSTAASHFGALLFVKTLGQNESIQGLWCLARFTLPAQIPS